VDKIELEMLLGLEKDDLADSFDTGLNCLYWWQKGWLACHDLSVGCKNYKDNPRLQLALVLLTAQFQV
jgi:hypothetical protein